MSARVCCHCGKPIACDRWEASISSRIVIGDKARIAHEHLACAIKADQQLSRQAYEAIFQAEKAGIA